MNENIVSREVQVDPYGHGKILPPTAFLPDKAVFVAEASVRYEAIGAIESYWLQDSTAESTPCSLWYKSNELPKKVFCCATTNSESVVTPYENAGKMLRALWSSRAPYAVSLGDFTKEGLLTRKWLDGFVASYRKAIEPTRVDQNDKIEIMELFYEDGNLRYRGEQSEGIPHGSGIGYWENGNVWCDGYYKNNKPHGRCRVYFSDGTLRHVGNFSEGYPRGWGEEYFDNGQLWFAGTFGKQTIRYGWGARRWEKGKLYDRDGNLKHDGAFESVGHQSHPSE